VHIGSVMNRGESIAPRRRARSARDASARAFTSSARSAREHADQEELLAARRYRVRGRAHRLYLLLHLGVDRPPLAGPRLGDRLQEVEALHRLVAPVLEGLQLHADLAHVGVEVGEPRPGAAPGRDP
jgi:hypothetical protein